MPTIFRVKATRLLNHLKNHTRRKTETGNVIFLCSFPPNRSNLCVQRPLNRQFNPKFVYLSEYLRDLWWLQCILFTRPRQAERKRTTEESQCTPNGNSAPIYCGRRRRLEAIWTENSGVRSMDAVTARFF